MSSLSRTATPSLPATPRAFVWCYNRLYLGYLIATLLLQVLGALCTSFIPYALGEVTGAVTAPAQPGHFDWHPVTLLIVLVVGELLARRAMTGCMIVIRPRQRRRIIGDLYNYLQGHSHRYFAEHFAGSLSQRINETAVGFHLLSWLLIAELLPVGIILLTALGLLAWVSPWLGLGLLLWTLVFVALSYRMSRRAQVLGAAHAEQRSQTSGTLVDAIGNMGNVRFFARQDHERCHLDRFLRREKRKGRRAVLYMERIRWMQDGMALVLQLGLVVASLLLWEHGLAGAQMFVMSASLGLLIVGNARSLSYQLLELFEALGDVQNGVTTLLVPHELPDRQDARDVALPQGAIEFRDLTFGYRPDQPIFRHLSLSIPAGQRVGVVGYSGSGKSTLLSLLLRLYEPQSGAILIDGHDIRDLTLESLHRQIGLIPQEPSLFHRSLRENIAYGDPAAEQDGIEAAARRAHAHDFIAAMPEGYDALVGERGVKLSGGQRQRIAIARALLKAAPILILDEATSSLDSETERLIQGSLDEIMGDKTVLVVAHRLSTIAHLDRILVFSEGQLIEDGSHRVLLQRGGVYSQLWSHQSHGRLGESHATESA